MKVQKKALADRKSRDAKRKLRRLAHERNTSVVVAAVKRLRKQVDLTMMSLPSEQKIMIGVAPGLMATIQGIALNISHETLAGCAESKQELATLVNNVGILALSKLAGHDLSYGLDGLAEKLCAFAGLDLEAIRSEAERDDAEQATSGYQGVDSTTEGSAFDVERTVETRSTREMDPEALSALVAETGNVPAL